MSDDEVQLTTADYNAVAAAGLANVGALESSTSKVSEAANGNFSEPPATTSSPGNPSLSGGYRFGPTETSITVLPGFDQCPPYDAQQLGVAPESTERHHRPWYPPSGLHFAPSGALQPQQPTSSNRDTPRWIRCTERQWAAIVVCVIIKIIFLVFVSVWIRQLTYNW